MDRLKRTASRLFVLSISLILLISASTGCGSKHDNSASSGFSSDPTAAVIGDQEKSVSLADLSSEEPPAPALTDGPRDAFAPVVGVPPLGAAGGPAYSGYYKSDMAFDGDPRTWWAGERNKATWDLYYGLSSTIALTQLNINFYSSQYTPTAVKLYTSVDGATWTVSAQIDAPTSKPSFTLSSVSAKYIRIEMTGNPPAGIPIIREIDWLPKAFKTGPSAGPNYNDDWYFASNAFDNTPNTWWAGKASAGAWDIFYNFGTPRQIGLLSAVFYAINTRPATVSLYTSPDGITWTKTGDLSPEATSTIFVGAPVQYIRISMAGNPPSSFPLIKDIYLDALPGAASPDSFNSNYRAENAFDNKPASLWAGKKGQTEWNLYYNYSKPNGVNTVTIHYTDAAHTPDSTTLFTSYDGAIWTQSATFPAGAAPSVTVNDYAKHLRFKLATATATAAFFPTIKDINITNIAATPTVELTQVLQDIQTTGSQWTAGETSVSALPEPERVKLLGALPETVTAPRVATRNALSAAVLPHSFDWRNKDGSDWLTPIKNQGSCGSCVAFAAVGALEGLTKISSNNPLLSVDLSESDLFSCGGAYCGIGWYPSSGAAMLKNTGIVDEACLPYQPIDGVCSMKCSGWTSRVTKIDSWNYVPSNRDAIKNYILQGPVTAAIKVYYDFYYYRGGVYRRTSNVYAGGHAITIVGWNDADQAWIVKNSWGSNWGERGYIRVKYGEVEIEQYVIAMQKTSSAAAVVASASPTSAPISTGSANTTLTCAANGYIDSLEGRCDTTGDWTVISSGNTKICAYTAAGTYTPGCRVNNTLTSNVTTPVFIYPVDNLPPSASFSAIPEFGSPPLDIAFTGGCVDSDGTCASYSWNFGDGSPTISLQNPSHTFTSSGVYNVILTVTDNWGATATASKLIYAGVRQSLKLFASHTGTYSCMLYTDGTTSCWGANHYGQIGNGATSAYVVPPAQAPGVTGAVSVSPGSSHTCALLNSGTVKCWGDNAYGQIGVGTIGGGNRLTPAQVTGLTGVSALASGNLFSCALLSNGTVKCWGYNSYYQLGVGNYTNSGVPLTAVGLSGVTAISSGGFYACALINDGTVKCWGSNMAGQSGDPGSTSDIQTPRLVAGLSGATAIVTGYDHTCALLNNGTVKCWGNGSFGALGRGSFVGHDATPAPVLGLTNVIKISSGAFHTCALISGGTVKCWGWNVYAQAGAPSGVEDVTTPFTVPGLSDVADIECGRFISFAKLNSGVLKGWGHNGSREIINSSTTYVYAPPVVVEGF